VSEIQSSLHIPVSKERAHQNRGISDSVAITVGVTGTRYTQKITNTQVRQLRVILQKIYDRYSPNGECWLAHGDCDGWDATAHYVARAIGYKIRIFPPLNSKHRACCRGDYTETPQTYSVRNQDIVRASDYIIVGPKSETEQLRSGTWATYRFARKRKVPHTIIYPNGRLEGIGWKQVLQGHVSPF